VTEKEKKRSLPEIRFTEDRSHTLWDPYLEEGYHSRHGAVQESKHVFIRHGYRQVEGQPVRILEAGFGTGLNALLTLAECMAEGRQVEYTTVELSPLPEEVVEQLNYPDLLGLDKELFLQLHRSPWGERTWITKHFSLLKLPADLRTCTFPGAYDLVYYDAFSAAVQPELWTPELFSQIASRMVAGGILVTYAARGSVKRALRQAGLQVERLPGPPGKREMIRAVKP